MTQTIITNGTVISMDHDRRVIEHGAVVIDGDRIVAVGDTDNLERDYNTPNVINANNMVIMPGLIDSHGHAGHAMVKTMGDGYSPNWYESVTKFYTEGATINFWKADAQLVAVDRLKNGVTTAYCYFGGGNSISRVDDPIYALEHLKAVNDVGVREILALGPCPPPYPTRLDHWSGITKHEKRYSFEEQLAVTEEVILSGHKSISNRLQISVTFPLFGYKEEHISILNDLRKWTDAVKDLYKKYQVLFTQDGHRRGTIQFQHDNFGFSGSDVLFSHCIDLTEEEMQICEETGTRIIHNPSSVSSIRGRCPVPELIDRGVIVMLGSDAAAPDRGYDMFRHMFMCMHYHRTFFKDERYLPPGKVLEMATIDAAKGLGMDAEIGSIEVGKKADIILINMEKPHLYPLNMIPSRIAYFAHGSDVDTVIVDGKILMQGRQVKMVSEEDVLKTAQYETEAILDRTGTRKMLELSSTYWGRNHY